MTYEVDGVQYVAMTAAREGGSPWRVATFLATEFVSRPQANALKDSPEVAAPAAKALGEIGTSEAAKALVAFRASSSEPVRAAAADGSLICAERLVASGQRREAVAILNALNVPGQPAHVQLAASRALSMATRP
jgi:HEAT repeat protein